MARDYNFSPGPSAVPDAVMAQARDEFMEYRGEGASIMEISHRGGVFLEILDRAESLLRELLGVGDDYAVLFLSGGATGCAASLPLNLAGDREVVADYIVTGLWSRRAADEGTKYCDARVVADTKEQGYSVLPGDIDLSGDAAFVHYADNETVHGVEFDAPPSAGAPLAADMSSNILSRSFDLSAYGAIYAGAQKNLGIAGISLVVARKALLRPRPETPMIWNYAKQAADRSLVNTIPTFPVYIMSLVLEWVREQGGVEEMARRAERKSGMIYGCMESGFYRAHAAPECRSRMNVPFFLADDRLTASFLEGARERGLRGLAGHKALGGCRASLYNAMPEAGAQALADYMRDFEKRRG